MEQIVEHPCLRLGLFPSAVSADDGGRAITMSERIGVMSMDGYHRCHCFLIMDPLGEWQFQAADF